MLYRFDARNILSQFTQLARIAQLLRRQLHAQGELAFAQIEQLLAQISIVLLSQFVGLHYLPQMACDKGCRDW